MATVTVEDAPVVRAGIEQSNRAFEAALTAGDAAAVAANYTATARILPPNHPLVVGKSAIQAYWQMVLDMGITIELQTNEVEAHGATAWEVGEAVMKAGDTVLDTVKYIIIWKEEAGIWHKHRGTWNSNSPQ